MDTRCEYTSESGEEVEWGVNGEDCSRFMYSLYLHLEIHSAIDLCAGARDLLPATLAFVDSDTGTTAIAEWNHRINR